METKGKYILDKDGNPKEERDLLTWAKWFEANDDKRIVERTQLDDVRVSTVFLGMEHNFGLSGKPILWETMVFGIDDDSYQERYDSLPAAKAGHKEATKWAKEKMKK